MLHAIPSKEWRWLLNGVDEGWPVLVYADFPRAIIPGQKAGANVMPDRSKYFQGGQFLKASDVKDGQLVTVDQFEEIKTRIGTRPILRIIGQEKPFGLNATNFDKMIEKFGENEKSWKGKKIRLRIVSAPNPQNNGKEGPALRIE